MIRLPPAVRVLEAALTAHLGSAPSRCHGMGDGNARHGQGQQTGHTDTGPGDRAVPRDGHGRCAPQRVSQRPRRLQDWAEAVVEDGQDSETA